MSIAHFLSPIENTRVITVSRFQYPSNHSTWKYDFLPCTTCNNKAPFPTRIWNLKLNNIPSCWKYKYCLEMYSSFWKVANTLQLHINIHCICISAMKSEMRNNARYTSHWAQSNLPLLQLATVCFLLVFVIPGHDATCVKAEPCPTSFHLVHG